MKLTDQIKDVATRWFNPEFATMLPIPRVVTSLAVEMFRRSKVDDYTDEYYQMPFDLDHRIVKRAMQLLDNCELRADAPGVE